MGTLRQGISLGLIVCLFHLCLVDAAWPVEKGAPDAAAIKQQVTLFGVGAEVKLRLADGTKLSGPIRAIEDTTFGLSTGPAGNLTKIAYDQVTKLSLATKSFSYRASSPPDLGAASRTALSLAGKNVTVRMTSGDKVHGIVQTAEQDRFTLLPSRGAPMSIAYTDVAQLGSHTSAMAYGILLGVAGGVALAIAIFLGSANH